MKFTEIFSLHNQRSILLDQVQILLILISFKLKNDLKILVKILLKIKMVINIINIIIIIIIFFNFLKFKYNF